MKVVSATHESLCDFGRKTSLVTQAAFVGILYDVAIACLAVWHLVCRVICCCICVIECIAYHSKHEGKSMNASNFQKELQNIFIVNVLFFGAGCVCGTANYVLVRMSLAQALL